MKADELTIGNETIKLLKTSYAGNPGLFIPFAGEQRPQSPQDLQVLGLGLKSAAQLFREMNTRLAD
ncbi:MAG TPA: hypothetical protein ENI23_14165 [bacterium]|nr:hypothetical protein [bacterium]